ncbi:hypothetical protein C475_20048 [Halosimplex carlsbadense 2-9-1]|uniref:Uncharacterized protein n=1 Tax=Halosimplex carlsbadense 2-9-1 TaxID=797114 RepID=M0CBD6_9EURY|nr:hypothetical protein [Halosimplex carlsbadense]ELZ20591.1 hypothetical protein C475_20048 [Halosimplex carlsbadense 2-9-1]
MPGDTLPVHVSRDSLHALEVPDAFETDGSFDIGVVNHGGSVHVHIHLDDDLSEIATVEAGNHFVDSESKRAVHVSVQGAGEATGTLKIASAYGAETRYVTVRITEPDEEESTVEVDESLSQPQPREPDAGGNGAATAALAASPQLVVLALGVLALGVAAALALLVDEVVVVAGALAVLVGVLAAVYIALAGE